MLAGAFIDVKTHAPPTRHSTNEPTKDRLILTIIPCCIIRPNVHRHWTIVVVPHSVWRWKCVCTSHLLPTQVRKNPLFSVFSHSTREKETKKGKSFLIKFAFQLSPGHRLMIRFFCIKNFKSHKCQIEFFGGNKNREKELKEIM